MKILLVEDEYKISKVVSTLLSKASIDVEKSALGRAAMTLCLFSNYDVIIIDLKLPDMTGQAFIRELRKRGDLTPVVVFTTNEEVEHKIDSFEAGADDYLINPLQRDELIARIHAIVRRTRGYRTSMIDNGRLRMNLNEGSVCIDARPVFLTVKEFTILALLAKRSGVTMTKEAIHWHLYGGLDAPDLKIIDVFICKIRKKINAIAGTDVPVIETIWGHGYIVRPYEPEKVAPRIRENELAA